MQLIGMLDSPYVRRVAIALHTLGLPFDHLLLSVFRNTDEFSQINPLLKAPTFVCDDGEVLMDSTLILAYIARLVGPDQTLMPHSLADYQSAICLIGLGLNACDKTVQIEYERKRPVDKQYQPWRDRIQTQLIAAYDLLETYTADTANWLVSEQLSQADITVCVAWQFTQFIAADVINRAHYPALSALSQRAEALPAFTATPLEPNWQPSH
ncbi:MAG: glutathione S-transferase [Phormidesmis sp. RL_2_1]|nr:glutathione S-transferase [Phormidesmis sp. RL_2_1]